MSADHGGRRGATTVVGVALLLFVSIAVMSAIVMLGAGATDDTSRQLDEQRAEKLLTQFDSRSAMVALGSTSQQRIGLPTDADGQYRARSDDGWMNVTITDRTDGSTGTLLNETLGSVAYEGDGKTVAYQGGGVWASSGSGSTMVSPPEFHYRNATLTLPVVLVDGSPSLGDQAVITHRDTTQQFPDRASDENWMNPLTNSRVNVTVHSRYYDAWGRFFEQRTDGDVAIDHENRTATITLVAPPGNRHVEDAVAATAAGGEIRVSGNGARTDSYNSTDGGRYATTASSAGTITTAGEVYVGGAGEVRGSIRSGKSVKVTGSGYVDGNVSYTTSEQVKTSQITGTLSRIGGVDGDDPIDSFVDNRVADIRKHNDNGDTGAISGTTLDVSGTETLDEGRYYVDALHLSGGDTLVLETGDENVSIAVRDYVTVEEDSEIEVRGDGRANVYVRGDDVDPVSKAHFTIPESGGQVQVPEENATQFWMYGKRDFEATISGSSSETQRFEGVIYAPGGSLGSSAFHVKHGELYGGVVTADVRLDQGGSVHYDRALTGSRVLPENTRLLRVTYLHVSTNRIDVDG